MKRIIVARCMAVLLALAIICPPCAGIKAEAAGGSVLGNGTTYYISNSGNDSNSGTSESQAWRSLEKVNETIFQPGDSILLERGGVWTGTFYPKGSGLPGIGNSIYVDAYGSGAKPLIQGSGARNGSNGNSPVSAAVYLYNQQYWEIRSLEMTNWDPGDIDTSSTSRSYNQLAQRLRRGVYIYVDERAEGYTLETEGYAGNPGRVLSHIVLEDLYIHDVKGDDRFSGDGKGTGGIYVHVAGNVKSKIDDLQIRNNRIEDVGRSGISLLSNWQVGSNPFLSSRCYMTNVVVSDNIVRRAGGDGIIVIGLKDAIIEYNTISDANYSGPRHQMDNGPAYLGAWAVGMFPFFTDGTTIQYNEVYNTRTMDDGQAIDIDGQNNGAVVQYNFTHDNEGGAYLVMVDSYSNSRTFNTVIRYNISRNDNRTIFSIQSINNLLIYNNSVFVGKDMQTRLVGFSNQTVNNVAYWAKNVEFTNNLFMFFGKRANDTNTDRITNLTFRNNWYYGNWAPLNGEDNYELRRGDPGLCGANDLPDYWSAYAQQEIMDPRDRSTILEDFRLNDDSPLIDAGVVPYVLKPEDRVAPLDIAITNSVNIDMCDTIFNRREPLDYQGLTDFYGNDALVGSAPDIGACEFQGTKVYTPGNSSLFYYGAEAYYDIEPSSLTGTNDLQAAPSGREGDVAPYAGQRMLKVSAGGGGGGGGGGPGVGEIVLYEFDNPIQVSSDAHLAFYASTNNPGNFELTMTANMVDGTKVEASFSDWRNAWTPVYAGFGGGGGGGSGGGGGDLKSISIKIADAGEPAVCYIDDIRITELTVVPEAPEAANVAIEPLINGNAGAGFPVNGAYDYLDKNGDAESGSKYQWYISEDGINDAPINGATSISFTPAGADIGKFIKFGVTPANTYELGNTAAMTLSVAVEVDGFKGTTGFEAGEFPAMELERYTDLRDPLDYTLANFQTFMDMRNGISDTIARNGNYSYGISGLTHLQYGFFNNTIMVNPLFKTKYLLTADTKLSYWMYAKNEASTYAGLDFSYGASNAMMRNNANIVDLAGKPAAPGDAHGGIPVGTWVNVIIDLSPLAGQTVNELFITANPRGYTGTPIEAYFADIEFIEGTNIVESPPTASGVSISGSLKIGRTVTAAYVFRSPTGAPEYDSGVAWQRGDSYDGPFVDISGADALSYTLQNDDNGKYIRVAIIPRTAAMSGDTAYSAPAGPVTAIPEDDSAPVALGLTIASKDLGYQVSGNITRGMLTGTYTYFDADGDVEAGSTYRWLVSDDRGGPFQPIDGATGLTLPVAASFIGKYICFEVTPANENSDGKPVLSAPFPVAFYLFEAENMVLDNNFIKNTVVGASGAASDNVIRIDSNRGVGTLGSAYQKLDNIPSDTYDITVYYYDENDGNSPYFLYINDVLAASWVADRNFSTADPIEQSRTYYTLRGVDLTSNDVVRIDARSTDTSGGEWCRTDCFVLVPSIVANSQQYAKIEINGTETVAVAVPSQGETAAYTISAEGSPMVGAIDFSITVDGDYLSSKEFIFENGFLPISSGNYGTPLYWTNSGNMWTGKAVLYHPDGISGDFDIFTMIFNAASGKLGTTNVILNYAEMSYEGFGVYAAIFKDKASTEFIQWYSPYDLNRDGTIDIHDITFALQYLPAEEGDPNWDEAKIADVNTDKKVSIEDLILILANYTIPYYS